MTDQILIVEDDNIVAMEMRDRLQSLGYSVAGVAASGEAAITMADTVRPDLVLMDIKLRGTMDGVEAAAEIRSRLDIPVVYLTAYADTDTLQRAKVTEPYGYIIKPFQYAELQTTIEMAVYKHKMEHKLRQSEQWLATTLRSISDAVLATDSEGTIVFMNPVAEKLTGWSQNDALGKPFGEVFRIVSDEGSFPIREPIAETLRNGQGFNLANRLLRTNEGMEMPIEGSCAPIRDDRENVNGLVLTFRDISERRREQKEKEKLQAQLFQAQKMEAIGLFAGGIAHDLSNQMTPVIGYSSLLLSWLHNDDPVREKIEIISKSGERAAALIQQILAFSRRQMPKPRVLDLNAVVISMEEMFHRLVRGHTQVVKLLEPGFRYVKADPTQIEQVVINLVINAIEAMPDGGRLTIETEYVAVSEDQCSAPDEHAGAYVCLSVTDTGIGMDEETMQRLGEPFFSTKKTGTGLGLSTAYTIISQYDGWTRVQSKPGKGSAFRVFLPACADLDYEAAEIKVLTEFHGKGEKILLVEDDACVRATITEMLRAGGYHVVEVEDAEAALNVFEGENGNFQLVFSDVVLPKKDGLQLVDELLEHKPELSVILSSGYADQRSRWPIIRDRGYHFLPKPYGLPELLPVVKEALSSRKSLSTAAPY